MNAHEFALVAFTILVQMSVGAFVVLGIVHTWAIRKAGEAEADRLADRALIAILATLVLGLIASLFHLGNPINAYLAVLNVGSSWLSREILLGVMFAVLGFLFAFLQWRKIGSARLRMILGIITALVGLVLVYAMSQVYRLPTQPAWNSMFTTASFYVTTFLLGAVGIGAAFVFNYGLVRRKTPECADIQCTLLRESLRGIALASIVLLGVEFVLIPLRMESLSAGLPEAVQSAALMATQYRGMSLLRLLLVFLGVAGFSMFIYINAASVGKERVIGYAAYASFVLVLIAETLGRYMFYAAHIKIGI